MTRFSNSYAPQAGWLFPQEKPPSTKPGFGALARELLLAAAPGNRGDHQDFVILLEVIFLIAEKADVFLVDVKVDEAANLTVIAAQVLAQGGKLILDLDHKFRQIGSRRRDLAHIVGVFLECIRQQNSNGHSFLPRAAALHSQRCALPQSFQSR